MVFYFGTWHIWGKLTFDKFSLELEFYKYSALFRKNYQKELRIKLSKFYGEEKEEPY